jgi:hypothetical protein
MNSPLHPESLRLVIQQTLTPIGLYSLDAEEILMATCANESNFGIFRTQAPHGPARGIFQMEGEDFDDIWNNYLKYKGTLAFQVRNYNKGQQGTADDMVNNDQYAICMARVHYSRKPGVLPAANNIEAIWAYYKQWYNTPEGAATHDAFIAKYNRYVKGQT